MLKPEVILKYFNHLNENDFSDPAPLKQISVVEHQIGIIFPDDYKEFLIFTNGLSQKSLYETEFTFSYFISVEEITKHTKRNCGEYFPWAIFIGSDGGNEMYVIDKRQNPIQFGLLPFIGTDEDFIPLGNTFEQFISRIFNGTAFDK